MGGGGGIAEIKIAASLNKNEGLKMLVFLNYQAKSVDKHSKLKYFRISTIWGSVAHHISTGNSDYPPSSRGGRPTYIKI